jgi:hypothetical protein
MIGSLSLSNVLTVLIAVICLWTTGTQSSGGIVRTWRLAVPPCLAAADAVILLAGVFDATLQSDTEWLVAALLGAAVGRTLGWTAAVEADRHWGLIRLQRTIDGTLAGFGLLVLSLVDFGGAALGEPILGPPHVAAGAAFCAGLLAFRALAMGTRASRAPHVALFDIDQPSR